MTLIMAVGCVILWQPRTLSDPLISLCSDGCRAIAHTVRSSSSKFQSTENAFAQSKSFNVAVSCDGYGREEISLQLVPPARVGPYYPDRSLATPLLSLLLQGHPPTPQPRAEAMCAGRGNHTVLNLRR
jgi:hypothetical protein